MAVARTGDGRGCVRGSRGWPWPCRGSCARRRGRPRASCAGDVVAAPRRARPWLRRAGKAGPVPGEAAPAAGGSRARRPGKPRRRRGKKPHPPPREEVASAAGGRSHTRRCRGGSPSSGVTVESPAARHRAPMRVTERRWRPRKFG
jgi:hypothetical protein